MRLRILALSFILAASVTLTEAGQFYFNGNQLLELDNNALSAKQSFSSISITHYFGELPIAHQLVIAQGEIKRTEMDDVTEGYSLNLLSTSNSGLTPIGTPQSVVLARVSPTSDEIAIITKDNQLHLLQTNGTEKNLVPESMPVTQFNWSPDGTQIVFVGWPEGWKYSVFETATTEEQFEKGMESDIFILNVSSGEIKQLTHSPKQDFKPIWSPDGKKILFVSARTRFLSFYLMDTDGSNQTQLTNIDYKRDKPHTPVQTNNIIEWNQEGTGIVYQTSIKAYEKSIWYIQPDGSNSRMIGLGTNPQWDEKGMALIFTQPDGNVSIWNSKENTKQSIKVKQ